MFYFHEPYHFKTSAFRYIGDKNITTGDLLSKFPQLMNNHSIYEMSDLLALFSLSGVKKQTERKMWIVPYNKELTPYIKRACISSHKNNMTCIILTTTEDHIPVEIAVNIDYFLIDMGLSIDEYTKIYDKHELFHYITWDDYRTAYNSQQGFMVKCV